MSKRILVGHYCLGFRNITVYANPGTGSGSVNLSPEDRSNNTEVMVGMNNPWGEVLSTFLHELLETAFIDVGGRFKRQPTYCEETSDFNFFLTHNEFSDAVDRAGYVIKDAEKDLFKVFKKVEKDRSKK